MLFLFSRRVPSSYPILALIATNLVISMPAPPYKRSPADASDARNGFSSVPKVLEIQLPLKIASKDDLVAWAKYVMGLMASRINITLTTVKELPSKHSGSVPAPDAARNFDSVQQPLNSRNSALKGFDAGRPHASGIVQPGNGMGSENARYAENVRNLATSHATNVDRARIPAAVRILENPRNPPRNGHVQLSVDKHFPSPQLSSVAINEIALKNFLNRQPTFVNLGVPDSTLPNPLEIAANANSARSKIKEAVIKATFDNSLKIADPQMLVPQFPDFGPVIDAKAFDVFRNATVVPPPARTYLPVTTTADNIRFPSDPFVTRYFFDGVERNASGNLGVLAMDVAPTTQSPQFFGDEIPLPVRSTELASPARNASFLRPLFNVPFEAVITFNNDGPTEMTTMRNDRDQSTTTAGRDFFDQFPPYFDSNYTQTNESGQINVVFDDAEVTEAKNGTKKEEKKKQERKKESSKKQKSKKQKTTTRLQSPISQFLKTFMGLRRNNTPAADLTPPPLNQELTTQRVPARQVFPSPQRGPPPQGPQQYYPPRNPTSALRQGRRNQTSLAQSLEDDDDDDSGSREDNSSAEDKKSQEDSGSREGGKSGSNESKGNADVESSEETGNGDASESSSSESEYDDSSEEEEGGSVKAVIELLQLAAPVLEDLSDPESDTSLAEVLETAIPLLQDLSEGDGENEGFDIPGILLPILLQASGGMDGMGDSAAILTPLIQLIAPLSGPLSGPLLMPLSRQSSNPPGQGGSSSGDILKASLDPLLQPIGPGMMTGLSNLVAGVISSLSKNSAGGGKSDIATLVRAIVSGSVAGTSAGSSGSPNRDSYGAPTSYGGESYGPPSPYGQPNTPSTHPNPILLLGSSFKDILNAILKVVASLVSTISGVLGASSNSANEPRPTYGPPRHTYGPPRPTYGPPRSTYGPPRRSSYNGAPLSETISLTTSRPDRFSRF